ncbi:MAG: ABC transporter permease subunit [Defluviitaleaceae bacterium]|nr:ABC transporter permease subunit [Defluviitaleaceae bacterium]
MAAISAPNKGGRSWFRRNRAQHTKPFGTRFIEDIKRNWSLYVMVAPVLAYFIIFQYGPMYGAQIAFRHFRPADGIWGSQWVGIQHFRDFFGSVFFWRLLRNTLRISLYRLLFEFPAPILLALLINEVRHKYFARTIQTITYMPFFISMIVVAGLIRTFVDQHGIITQFFGLFGMEAHNMLNTINYFLPILIVSDIWQSVGWGSIIFLAALQGIDQEQYEAAAIDGAGRLKQTLHVTLPGIMPTIIILLILRMGTMVSVGAEKILLLYSPLNWEVSDVISTFVYRRGLLDFQFSFASAVGLFNSVVNITFLLSANYLSRRVSQDNTSLF